MKFRDGSVEGFVMFWVLYDGPDLKLFILVIHLAIHFGGSGVRLYDGPDLKLLRYSECSKTLTFRNILLSNV